MARVQINIREVSMNSHSRENNVSFRVRTLLSGQKFKDFPGPYFEISRSFLYTNLPTAKQNVYVESYILGINLFSLAFI